MAIPVSEKNDIKFRERPVSDCHEKGAGLLAELYARRSEAFVQRGLADLLRPTHLMGLADAVKAIAGAIQGQQQIVIVADYDADGATACAIGIRGIRMMGGKVDFVVPNRFSDGYGLTVGVIDRAMQKKPGLILTVDNGIAAIDGVKYANSKGVPVVVTDHHLAGEILPDALAIVNPNQPGCQFGSKNLAGCGVMFYVLGAVRRYFADRGDSRGNAPLQTLLDILALGTVADLVRLDPNNRILVAGGIRQIRAGRACAGIRALFEISGRQEDACTATDLGFSVAPRINAAGRMDDAAVGIRCLIEDDPEVAHHLAAELQATNLARRETQEDIQKEAELRLEQVSCESDFSIVVADESWHEGVIGIVAGRLKELHNRPVIVMTKSEDGYLKGSGRSIPVLHLRDAIAAVSTQLPGVVVRFGGHAMAAGLTIKADAFEIFRQAFELQVRTMLNQDKTLLDNVIEHDGLLASKDLTLENAQAINNEVWGQGFPKPAFLVEGKMESHRILKDKHTKMQLGVGGQKIDVILFNQVLERTPRILVCGGLDVNVWNGKSSLQILASHAVPA